MVSHLCRALFGDHRYPGMRSEHRFAWPETRFMPLAACDHKHVVLVKILFGFIVNGLVDGKNVRVEFVGLVAERSFPAIYYRIAFPSDLGVIAVEQVAVDVIS